MADVSRAQGLSMGRLADVGMPLRDRASLSVLTEDVIETSEIEGEQLNVESVRSSIACRLGVDIGILASVVRHVEGVVEMVLDASAKCNAPVTRDRLFSSKWAAIAKCSPDTALRDLTDLLAHGVPQKSDARGRSSSYKRQRRIEVGRPSRNSFGLLGERRFHRLLSTYSKNYSGDSLTQGRYCDIRQFKARAAG